MNKPKITQKQQQNLLLSPQQLIKANILQLNSMMLEARLYQEIELNPALEIMESDADLSINDNEVDNENEDTQIEDEENQDLNSKDNIYNENNFESTIKNHSTIYDQVILALRDDNLTDDELQISEQIIGNLDDQGYLKIDTELISDKLNVSNDIVLKVLEKIKHSKFPGLAAINIQDCLLAQLKVYNISDIAF